MKVIGKRYQIEKEIGAGGMGTVFLGLDQQSEQQVAIKALKKELTQPEMLERFKREGQALRELNHPNIVKLLDTLDVEGQYYLVMEYVAAGDLRQLLQNGKLPYQRCLNIAIDLADALTRAHRLNIIHRDLKPANVLVAQDGTIRLTDFGVAHVVDKERVTETDAIIGTLDYLPPEVLNGEAVEPRSDIWAFGVMLFEMLAGQRPFNGTGYIQTLQAIATAPIPDLEALAPDAPIALVDLVYRMLNRDPQARISSVRHIGAELEDILQGRAKQSRFEAPTSFNPPKHNFPVQVTDFVGREEELRQIARFYADTNLHLLTIVGQGGMGKTRLMLEVAWRLMSENIDLLPEYPSGYKDGGYFIELAPLRTLDEVIAAIAQGLGYQFQNDERSQKQQILDYLKHKELGLLLDNFEHIMEASSIVAEIIQTAPHVRIAVTSRERLNLPGEQVFQLKGIEYPDTGKFLDAADYPAVKLFLQTAKRVNPAYEMQNADLAGIVEICKLAEGLPLAIILAASWLEMLSVREVLAEMQKSIDFLASNSRGTVERHRSIRAVFEYSWQLLTEAEQDVFPKLSLFRGGFTREAAEAVAGANLRILMSLVNKSLLRRNNTTGRYEIHELLRQYGEEKVQETDEQDLSYLKLKDYFAKMLSTLERDLQEQRQLEALAKIEADFENLRFVWDWAIHGRDLDTVLKMLEGLRFFTFARSQFAVWEKLITFAHTELKDYEDSPTGANLAIFVLLNNLQRSPEALERARKLAEKHHQIRAIAFYWFMKTSDSRNIGNFATKIAEFDKSIQYFQSIGDQSNSLWISIFKANIYASNAEFEHAIEILNQSASIARKNHDHYNLGRILINLVFNSLAAGKYQDAEQFAREALVESILIKRLIGQSNSYSYLAMISFMKGDFEEAEQLIKSAIRIATDIQAQNALVTVYIFKAIMAAIQGNYQEAREYSDKTQSLDVTEIFLEWILVVFAIVEQNFVDATKTLLSLMQATLTTGSKHIFCWTIPLVSILMHHLGQRQVTLELLDLIYAHPIIMTAWLDHWHLFHEVKANLSYDPSKIDEQTFERCKNMDLESVIQQILAESDGLIP